MAGDSATIRLRFDTSGSRGDLDALDRRVDQSARAAQRSLGGGGGMGGGIMGRVLSGGFGALLGGLGIGALAAQLGGPVVGDALKVSGGILGAGGESISSFLGLRQLGANVDAARQAQQDTVNALGPAAANMGKDAIGPLYETFLRLRKQEQAGRLAVEDATRGAVAAEAAQPLVVLLERIANAVERQSNAGTMATGPAATVPGPGR